MKSITKSWWAKCLNDKEKLEHWLVSLYNNEKDAEIRFARFAKKYCMRRTDYEIFMKISKQESEHAVLVESVLKSRGITIYEKSSSDGKYWRNTLPCICDLSTAAAVGAFAESLSLNRMRVIIKDQKTPEDIRNMFKVIEPEESYHAKVLKQIASNYGMKRVKDCHDKGLEELGLRIKNVKYFTVDGWSDHVHICTEFAIRPVCGTLLNFPERGRELKLEDDLIKQKFGSKEFNNVTWLSNDDRPYCTKCLELSIFKTTSY